MFYRANAVAEKAPGLIRWHFLVDWTLSKPLLLNPIEWVDVTEESSHSNNPVLCPVGLRFKATFIFESEKENLRRILLLLADESELTERVIIWGGGMAKHRQQLRCVFREAFLLSLCPIYILVNKTHKDKIKSLMLSRLKEFKFQILPLELLSIYRA